MSKTELATFSGGCFWCIEAPFVPLKGVVSTVAGYCGGRESVQITFDPAQISYQQLLDLFWLQIDPTDPGGQFYDRGHQYTTAIYCHTDEQRKLAEASKEKLDKSGKYAKPIATLVLPAEPFQPAADYHQKFYLTNPEHYQNYKKASGREAFIKEMNKW